MAMVMMRPSVVLGDISLMSIMIIIAMVLAMVHVFVMAMVRVSILAQ